MASPSPRELRLAMVGMVDGNGHPYSWSAIINGGFNAEAMARCPYDAIPKYLGAQPSSALGIDGVKVTHIWCDDPAEAHSVAEAALIPHIVRNPLDVIGNVDAVVIPTDKPEEHLDRARPFIEAGIPVFIDKPMTDQLDHLSQFVRWQREGKQIMSSSGLRYAVEYADLRRRIAEVGDLRLVTMTMCKSWERYGIHALEAVYPMFEPGKWLTASHRGDAYSNLVHLRHASGVDVMLTVVKDMFGGFGQMNAYGTKGHLNASIQDTFTAFKTQMVEMVNWLRTGQLPFPFEETVELMRIIIAVIRSRSENGRVVQLSEVQCNS